MFSLGHGMMASNPSIKYDNKGDKNASWVISFSRTVTELNNISSVTNRTINCIVAFTAFTPSEINHYILLILVKFQAIFEC